MAKRLRDISSASSSDVEPAGLESSKYFHADEGERTTTVIRCFLPPHSRPYAFSSYDEHDEHYRKFHTNRCLECKKNFPTDRFLNLHIAENHDSLTEARKARGEKMYGCFVEGCDKVCQSPQRRRLHLVDKHGFPKNYNFFVVNDGLDKRNSMLRPSSRCQPEKQYDVASNNSQHDQSSATSSSNVPVESTQDADAGSSDGEDELSPTQSLDATSSIESGIADAPATPASSGTDNNDMDSLTKSMSSLNFVPPSIRFGRGRGRGFPRR